MYIKEKECTCVQGNECTYEAGYKSTFVEIEEINEHIWKIILHSVE